MQKRRTAVDVALLIENFLDGSVGAHDWDDFESNPLSDPTLESVRKRCAAIPSQFPSLDRNTFASPDGLAALRQIATELRRTVPEVETARRRAHQIGLLAKSLYAGSISSEVFVEGIESEDYENPYVIELLDRIEHQPARGGVFGASAAVHDQHVARVQAIIARVLEQTSDAAV
jgi:hypothetical protein